MTGTTSRFTLFAAAFALLSGSAFASDDVVVSKGAANDLLVTVNTEAANVHFTYALNSCDRNIPCFVITAGRGMVGVPASAGGGCKVQAGNGYTPVSIECPASGIGAVTFAFMKGGTWSAYEGGGGLHSAGPCSPAPVTVKTGPGGGAISVNSWNGCTESVICNSPPAVFSAVEADAADAIRGKCMSVIRH